MKFGLLLSRDYLVVVGLKERFRYLMVVVIMLYCFDGNRLNENKIFVIMIVKWVKVSWFIFFEEEGRE